MYILEVRVNLFSSLEFDINIGAQLNLLVSELAILKDKIPPHKVIIYLRRFDCKIILN